MHSIERYGIVALIFLVVTVVAVLMWDGGKDKKKALELAGTVHAPAQSGAQLDQPLPLAAENAARRLELEAQSQPGPLMRHPRAAQLAAEAGGAQPLSDGAGAGQEPFAAGAAPLQSKESATNAPAPGGTLGEQRVIEPVVGQTPPSQPSLQPREQASTPSATRTYVVRAGDTLSQIAARELGSAKRWNEILAVNPGLEPAKLRSGKKIQLPGAAGGSGAAALTADAPRNESAKASPANVAKNAAPTTKPTSQRSGARTHTVGKGENLWKIAERTLGDGKRWKEITALNPGLKADKLVLGQVLKLPGDAPAAGGSGAKMTSTKVAAQTPPADTRVASLAGGERPVRGGKVK